MAKWRIVELVSPQDEAGFREAFQRYKVNPSLYNPLNDFVPDRWRFREEYDDESGIDGSPDRMPIDKYLIYLNATTGRLVKVVP